MAFLEESFPVPIDYGSSFGEPYAVDEVTTNSGNDYRRLRHPYPRLTYQIGVDSRIQSELVTKLLDFYHRSGGRFGGFRIKNNADFSTNGYTSLPSPTDQICIATETAGQYQIIRWYGPQGVSTSTRRRIRKPVAGTVLVGIRDEDGNDVQQSTGWSVDTTTGIVTFAANELENISNISQASEAVVTIGAHTLTNGVTVHFSGVTGMTQINGLRGTITGFDATTITVDIDTTGFSAYSSGGQINTRPQAGEIVTAGCLFDIPVRFESDLSDMQFIGYRVMGASVSVVEILNP